MSKSKHFLLYISGTAIWIMVFQLVFSDKLLSANSNDDYENNSSAVERFVHKLFIDDLPIEKMKQFAANKNDVGSLLNLLKTECRKEEEQHPLCSNVVVTLGFSGDRVALDGIRSFLQQKKNSQMQAKNDALLALGYWVHQSDSEEDNKVIVRGLANLINQCDPQASQRQMSFDANETQGLRVDIPVPPTPIERQGTRRTAILGLALSGNTNVEIRPGEHIKEFLETLLKQAPVGTSDRALIIEALEAHNKIAAFGLDCFYDKHGKSCRKRVQKISMENTE